MPDFCALQGGPCTGNEQCCRDQECVSCGRKYRSNEAARACADADDRTD